MTKKGFLHLPIILLAVFIALISLNSTTRRTLHLASNHLALQIGFNLNNIASDEYVSWITSQLHHSPATDIAIYLNQKVATNFPTVAQSSEVLGTNTPVDDSKWIETDLSEQRLYMKENGNTVGSFLVSTGKWFPTPTGEWRIWTKLRYTTMAGGSKALGTYYYLPNVPYTMYYDRGYGIHGAYWHNNFGQTMSHGCTNMKPEEAAIVFNWAQVGTRVIVHE